MNRLQRDDGVTLAFQVHNHQAPGVPLLLTHGFGATAGMWDPNIEALSVDRPVIVWDQRGHGSSDAPDDIDRYSEQISVADMAAILDAAGADRAVLGGMSLGGYYLSPFTSFTRSGWRRWYWSTRGRATATTQPAPSGTRG
jgi:pimeloyl-ACP methyl ester carboxylesterase